MTTVPQKIDHTLTSSLDTLLMSDPCDSDQIWSGFSKFSLFAHQYLNGIDFYDQDDKGSLVLRMWLLMEDQAKQYWTTYTTLSKQSH